MSVNRPKHIAIVMDGNGRWANKRSLSRSIGHKMGVNSEVYHQVMHSE